MSSPPDVLETLLTWWCGELTVAESEAVEERIFTDDDWAEAAERMGDLGFGIDEVIRAGAVSHVATRALLERLGSDDVSLQHYVCRPGETVPCTATPDDYTVVHLRGELEGADRLDVLFESDDGSSYRMEDVPVNWPDGEVVIARSGAFVRRLPDRLVRMTLYAVSRGQERVLGQYTLDHKAARA